MPFLSKSQRRWMYANDPKMAKKWEKHTPKGKKLPEHVKRSSDAEFIDLPAFTKIARKLFKDTEAPPVSAAELESRSTAPLVQGVLQRRVAKKEKAAQAAFSKTASIWNNSKSNWEV